MKRLTITSIFISLVLLSGVLFAASCTDPEKPTESPETSAIVVEEATECPHEYAAFAKDDKIHTMKCALCGNEYEEAHDLIELTEKGKAPSCLTPGMSTYKCTVCDKETVRTAPPLGHDFKDGTCARCGQKEDEEEETVEACGEHEYVLSEEGTKPTCEGDGLDVYYCVKCGERKEEKTDALGHAFRDVAKNTEETHRKTCVRCGREETEAHSFTYKKNDEGEHTKSCSVCGYALKESHDFTTAGVCRHCGYRCQHVMEITAKAEPDCTNKGKTEEKCMLCGYARTEYTDALGHSVSGSYTATEEGHSARCARCGESFLEAHAYGELKNDGENGHSKTCAVCNHKKTEEHELKEDAASTTATCTEAGVLVKKCACGYEKTETVEALGHTYKQAYKRMANSVIPYAHHGFNCDRCSEWIEEDHTYGEWSEWRCFEEGETTYSGLLVERGLAPYCGSRCERKATCSACGYICIETGHDTSSASTFRATISDDKKHVDYDCEHCGKYIASLSARDIEEAMFAKTNQYRELNGHAALSYDTQWQSFLDQRALEVQSDFSHAGFDNLYNNPIRRKACAENLVGGGSSYTSVCAEAVAEYAVDAWMRSEKHRWNMLADVWEFCTFGVSFKLWYNGAVAYYFVGVYTD